MYILYEFIYIVICKTHKHVYIYIYEYITNSNDWPVVSEYVSLLGQLTNPYCRRLLRHICVCLTPTETTFILQLYQGTVPSPVLSNSESQ